MTIAKGNILHYMNIFFVVIVYQMERYVMHLSQADLKARNVYNHNDYLNKYRANTSTRLSSDQLEKLQRALRRAEYLLDHNAPRLFAGLPWNLCKVGTDIEGGMPHTHEATIYYSDDLFQQSEEDMAETLIHERVHVLQRILPGVFHDLYINLMGYEHYASQFHVKQQRSNPDTFNCPLYTFQGHLVLIEYRNDDPKSLHDSSLRAYDPLTGLAASSQRQQSIINQMRRTFFDSSQLEHPNEVSACIIAKLIMDPSNFGEFNWLHERMYQWLLNTQFTNVDSEL